MVLACLLTVVAVTVPATDECLRMVPTIKMIARPLLLTAVAQANDGANATAIEQVHRVEVLGSSRGRRHYDAGASGVRLLVHVRVLMQLLVEAAGE